MPRTASSPADRPKWLRFEAGDEESHELFAPGANWRKQDQYPALKPLDSYTRDDYLRLAWELLRRMPRYRRQHRKLGQLGINSPSFFKSSPKHFYTSDSPPAFPGWATCPLRGHQCEPPIAGQDETFGSYIAAQEKAGQPWFVMNRYRWVMDLWGLTYVPNPDTPFALLRKSGLFGAPAAAVSVISNEAPADRPQNISTYLRANEVLVRLRLDASFDQQVESIRHEFERAQAIARKRPQRALDPLAESLVRHVLSGVSNCQLDGANLRIHEFDPLLLGDVGDDGRPVISRDQVDTITGTTNRQALIVGRKSGGAIVLVLQSAQDDSLLTYTFDTLSRSANRQLSGQRAGMFLVGLDGLEAESLLDLAQQDGAGDQPPTALRVRVSEFLASHGRDHVIGVGFISKGGLRPAAGGVTDSGGSAYVFPKRESPFWHDDFAGLFAERA